MVGKPNCHVAKWKWWIDFPWMDFWWILRVPVLKSALRESPLKKKIFRVDKEVTSHSEISYCIPGTCVHYLILPSEWAQGLGIISFRCGRSAAWEVRSLPTVSHSESLDSSFVTCNLLFHPPLSQLRPRSSESSPAGEKQVSRATQAHRRYIRAAMLHIHPVQPKAPFLPLGNQIAKKKNWRSTRASYVLGTVTYAP